MPAVSHPPECSILISIYNDEPNLDRCFHSIFNQTYQDFSIVCVNDSSTDNSLKIIESWQRKFGSKRFRLVDNPHNLGLTKSLNRGLNHISSRFTARLDGDDWWHPEKLARQVAWLNQNPDYGIIGCHFYGHTTQANRYKKHYFDVEDRTIRPNIFKRNPFAHSAVIFRTRLVKKLDGYNETCLYGQDYDLWLRLLPHTKFHNLNEFLCYRNTDTGLSIHKQRQQMLQSFKTRYRFINKYHYPKSNYRHLLEPLVLIVTPDFIKKIKRNFLPSNIARYFNVLPDHRINVYYLNDAILPNKFANAVARIAMAEAFAADPRIGDVTFLYFATHQQKPIAFVKNQRPQVNKFITPLITSQKGILTKSANRTIYLLALTRTFFINIPRRYDLVYLRTGSLAGFTVILRNLFNQRLIFFELHNYEFGTNPLTDAIYKFIFRRSNRVITISNYTRDNWINHGINPQKILVCPSGVHLDRFDALATSKLTIRRNLGLPLDKSILLYCGHLYRDRGIEDVIHAASLLKDDNYLFTFVGGAAEDIQYYQRFIKENYPYLSNIFLQGHVPTSLIPQYLKAAELLFVTYSRQCATINHMSPMKLFESMASRTPMITADVPRIRDIVDQSMTTFYRPDDPLDLSIKIRQVLSNYPQSMIKADRAHQEAARYTWVKRARTISYAATHTSA